MNEYETIFIMKNDITTEQQKEVIKKIKGYLNKHATIIYVEDLGLKKLAYELRKCKTGYYYLIDFKGESSIIVELERRYRINDNILKFITIKKD